MKGTFWLCVEPKTGVCGVPNVVCDGLTSSIEPKYASVVAAI